MILCGYGVMIMDNIFGLINRLEADGEPEVLTIEEDGVWYKLKDVCKYFGISNHKRWASRIDEQEKKYFNFVDSRGLVSYATFINEAGLYEILFTMNPKKSRTSGLNPAELLELEKRLKMVEDFKDWLFTEVLPDIRKYGTYNRERKYGLVEQLKQQLNKITSIQEKLTNDLLMLSTLPKSDDILAEICRLQIELQDLKHGYKQGYVYGLSNNMKLYLETGKTTNNLLN